VNLKIFKKGEEIVLAFSYKSTILKVKSTIRKFANRNSHELTA